MSPATLTKPTTWTLRAQVIAGVMTLFALIMLGTGAMTVLLARDYLTHQLDNDLVATTARVGQVQGGGGDRGGPPPGGGGGGLTLSLNPDGSVSTDHFGQLRNTIVNQRTNRAQPLTSEQLTRLSAAGLGSHPKSVDLGDGLGTYRVTAVRAPDGDIAISGLSTQPVEDISERILVLVSVATVLGLGLMGVGGTYVIRRNLQPLTRVAATARKVSTAKLDSGDVALTQRVATADADPHTEVGQVGLALNMLLDNVEGALRARQQSETRVRQFVADASHELRTPLASIRGYAELSRRETAHVPDGVAHALTRVESEAHRMTSLVEDLLLLARLDEGRPLARDEVDLSMLAINAVSDAHAASRNHNWALDLPDEPVTVIGDPARLTQVLTNLLANARVHTPDGTKVVTSLRHEGTQVRLSVTDDGPGIPDALQPNVFERFTRGEESRVRTKGSTGLGLSIVAAVAQAHGGRIELASRPGETNFSVLLPAA